MSKDKPKKEKPIPKKEMQKFEKGLDKIFGKPKTGKEKTPKSDQREG